MGERTRAQCINAREQRKEERKRGSVLMPIAKKSEMRMARARAQALTMADTLWGDRR